MGLLYFHMSPPPRVTTAFVPATFQLSLPPTHLSTPSHHTTTKLNPSPIPPLIPTPITPPFLPEFGRQAGHFSRILPSNWRDRDLRDGGLITSTAVWVSVSAGFSKTSDNTSLHEMKTKLPLPQARADDGWHTDHSQSLSNTALTSSVGE